MQPKDLRHELQDVLELRLNEKYYIDWQNRAGKQISLFGHEKTPVCLIEKRTQAGVAERQRNKTLLGLDKNSRNKETAHYIAHTSKKANCLTGAIHPVNLMIVQEEGGFGENSLAVRMPTPIECERLQGFPDNRTLVPRKDRMMSDTQRYKQA